MTSPSVGPAGVSSNVFYITAQTGRGANMIPNGTPSLSFPASAIDLRAGSLQFWFRSNMAPGADSVTRTLFAVHSGGAPVMVLEESDRLRFRIVTSQGAVLEAVGAVNAAVYPRWGWALIRAEWSNNTSDSLRVYVGGVRVAMSVVNGGWTIGAPSNARLDIGSRNRALWADGIVDELIVRSLSTSGSADAGVTPDAGSATPDSGSIADAGIIRPDAAPVTDAGTFAPDAAASDAGTVTPPPGGGAPSAGCGPTNGARGVYTRTLVVDGQTRSYLLSVPNTYDPRVPLALTFGWHGTNWNSAAFRGSGDMEAQSAGQSIFVYPQGNPNWNSAANSTDVRFFDAMYTDLMNTYCVDTSRVFTWGRSLGALFTHSLACQRGNRFAGNAALMGSGPSGSCVAPPPSAFIYHNQDDPTISWTSARASRDRWLQLNGCSTGTVPSNPASCVRYTQCANSRMVEWCSQPTGGHVPAPWTAGAIWRFFYANF